MIDERNWKADIQLLVEILATLRAVVAELKPDQLTLPIDSGTVTILKLVTGIAAHGLYHAG
jgi:hypothetical protein